MIWELIWQHLFIVLSACVLSIVIGLPLGILAYMFPRLRRVILRIVDLLQTIPSLALLGIIMVLLGAGKLTVIIGITLYSLLPIVGNTCLGLKEVDGGVKEAARGMGMSRLYRVINVEFPLAFPTVFTGIRIAIVNAIGSAVFAAFVGGGGLGSIINQGIRIQDMGLILQGTGALMVIAVLLDLTMGLLEGRIRKQRGSKKRILAVAGAVLLAGLLLMPLGLIDRTGENELVLYDGDYSETKLMHHMVKLLVEEHTDLSVVIKDQMSQVNNFKSLIGYAHTCDLMISYDGTLLTTFLKLDTEDVPDGVSIYDYANLVGEREHDVRLLDQLGFDNTYAVAVPKSIAAQYGLVTISDLVPVADQLIFGAEQEFFTLEGSIKYGPFTEFYGLQFKDAVSMEISLKYAAIENGSFQVTEVFATDGMNRKVGLQILDDDKSFFPDYNGAFLIRNDTITRFQETAPNLVAVLNMLGGRIPTEQMAELTYQVDVLGRTVDDVAHEFLVAEGLIQG